MFTLSGSLTPFRSALTAALVCVLPLVALSSSYAQTPGTQPPAPTVCGLPVPPPAQEPPADSPPMLYVLVPCFDAQGGVSAVEPETYLYYIHTKPSRPSQGVWVPFDDQAIASLREDFRRLWGTNFLDNLVIDTEDYRFANGVIGKLVVFRMEERPRIKVIEYRGSKKLDRTKIEERLVQREIQLRPDAFLDNGVVSRVEAVLREMLTEQGYVDMSVSHTLTPVAGGAKLVNLAFNVDDGPKTRIRSVEFVGNSAIGDRKLRGRMKENAPKGLLSFITGGGTYKETKFEEDAARITEYYRDRGYVAVRIGQPEIKTLSTEGDGGTRWIQLRIPVTEGQRYRVGDLNFEGNTVVQGDKLRPFFKVKTGEWYRERQLRDGLRQAQEIYGAAGYMDFTGFPDLKPDDSRSAVDITLRVQEGRQYFVNRIIFAGNTTTRDNVIRRQMSLLEGGVFNTAALKDSVRRLNQLGYFKPLDAERGFEVTKVGNGERVDITVKVDEQNRNQITFGAGLSQYEGLFGNLSYSTANFLGRGETVTITLQRGTRSGNYQLAVTEPYVFDRPISAGFDLYSRKYNYLVSDNKVGYSEVRNGISTTVGRPITRFSRGFLTYGYEVIDVAVSQSLLEEANATAADGVPLFNSYLDAGRHIESRVSPSFVFNTVDNPFTPRRGLKITAESPIAGGLLGGETDYIRPSLDIVWYIPSFSRTAFGLHASGGMVRSYGSTTELPYYLRYFLGGENQIRGVNIRTVGPVDSSNRALGGTRFVLFNAEYYFDVIPALRLLAFHDAGQAYSESSPIDLRQLRTSSGVEARVTLPVLNVPFRLIYAWNIYRDSFQPERALKFAVGTTF